VQFADQAPDEWAGEERLIEAELQQLRSEADTARQKAREVKTQLVGLRAAQTRDHAAGQATDHAVKELAHRQQTAEGDLQRLQSQADAADAKAAELATQLAALHAVQEKDRNAALAQNRATRQRVEDFLKEAKFEVFLEKRDDWILRKAAIPIQQQQFCHIIEQFEPELRRIEKVSNEIRRNLLFLDRRKDLETLLPQGRFGNWVLHVKEVTQAKDGSAAIVLQGPCPVMFGSDTCERNGSKISATVQKNTPMFRELTKLGNDDYVVASGTILFLTHEDQVQELQEEAVYTPGEYCSDNAGTKIQDVFVTDLNYLVQLR